MYQEVLEDIFLVRIPLPNSPLKSLNSYFIKADDGGKNLIVDSGFNNEICKAVFLKAMSDLKFTCHNTNFYATHLHGDHFALMQAMQDDINLYLGALDAQYLQKREQSRKNEDAFGHRDLTAATKILGMPNEYADILFKAEFMKNRKRKNGFMKLNEGDVFKVGKYNFEVILFAGHSPGQTGLYEKNKKILICGDHILGTISPNITFWDTDFDSLGSYISSLQKAKSLEIKHLLCGHRSNEFDVYERIDEIIVHHDMRLKEVVDILKKQAEPMTAFEIAAQMKWSIRQDVWKKYSKEQQWFASGEALAHMEHLYKREKIKKQISDDIFYYYV